MIFLSSLPATEAIALLEERREVVSARRETIEREANLHDPLYQQLAFDHLLSLIDAELAWVERSLQRLSEHQREGEELRQLSPDSHVGGSS